jgi:hypothetical protein
MDTLEIILTVIGVIIGPSIVIGIFLVNALQRLAKVEECVDPNQGDSIARLETKVDFMLKWIAALNGEMSDKNEFKEFLEQLREVAKGKGL